MRQQAEQIENKKKMEEEEKVKREAEDFRKDMALFSKLRIVASNDLKEWSSTTIKEAILLINEQARENETLGNSPNDRWVKFHRRMKVVLYSLKEEVQNMQLSPI